MTRIEASENICGVCGKSSEHIVMTSSNTRGLPDLDLRPSEMLRSTMAHWIQCCPSCRYCGKDISKGTKEDRIVVDSEDYQKLLKNKNLPLLANHFLCYSMILEKKGDVSGAGWSSLRAAWICDDVKNKEESISCRERAIGFFEEARKREQKFVDNSESEELIIIDLLRRSGKFKQAQTKCEGKLSKKHDENIMKLLRYEISLIKSKDDACHNIGEAQD